MPLLTTLEARLISIAATITSSSAAARLPTTARNPARVIVQLDVFLATLASHLVGICLISLAFGFAFRACLFAGLSARLGDHGLGPGRVILVVFILVTVLFVLRVGTT